MFAHLATVDEHGRIAVHGTEIEDQSSAGSDGGRHELAPVPGRTVIRRIPLVLPPVDGMDDGPGSIVESGLHPTRTEPLVVGIGQKTPSLVEALGNREFAEPLPQRASLAHHQTAEILPPSRDGRIEGRTQAKDIVGVEPDHRRFRCFQTARQFFVPPPRIVFDNVAGLPRDVKAIEDRRQPSCAVGLIPDCIACRFQDEFKRRHQVSAVDRFEVRTGATCIRIANRSIGQNLEIVPHGRRRRTEKRRTESQRVEIGLPQDDVQADRTSRQCRDVAIASPRDPLMDRVADDHVGFGQRASRQGSPRFVAQFNPCASRRRGGDVQREFGAVKGERLRGHGSAGKPGTQGYKAVGAQRVATSGRSVVDRHLGRPRRHHAAGGVVAAVAPPLRVESRRDERFGEQPFVAGAARPCRHEEDVGRIAAVGAEARRQRHVDVRGAKVGMRLARVEVFAGEVGGHGHRFGPVQKIGRCGPADRAETAMRRLPRAKIADVARFSRRPERDVLGVEGKARVLDHGAVLQRFPVDAVSRAEGVQVVADAVAIALVRAG